ncbi:hypothetical protein CLOSTMETH_03570 [[Clostridium] methylpentosum DSM 5476]|uniref:Uncharacterized protein n=1 Tax=[Clostridium] methylpentosum DSM 5476 TaxID=537013 RepID=C0EI75_9FIRM|nr:hypothetical protein CLOSTMETH_03570 [[Clostridium] methylpentosum DSM 5476]
MEHTPFVPVFLYIKKTTRSGSKKALGKNAKKIQESIQHQIEEEQAGEQLTMGNF